MSAWYIAEFSDLPLTNAGTPDFGMTPPLAQQTVSIGAGSTASSAFKANTLQAKAIKFVMDNQHALEGMIEKFKTAP